MKKFCVRRVKEMSILRLSERFADFGQVAFLAFGRYDSNLLDAGTHPVASTPPERLLTNAIGA